MNGSKTKWIRVVAIIACSIYSCVESSGTDQTVLDELANFVGRTGSSNCTAPIINNCAASSRCDFTCSLNFIRVGLDSIKTLPLCLE